MSGIILKKYDSSSCEIVKWAKYRQVSSLMCKKALFLVVGEVLSGGWPESFVLSYSF